MSATNAETATPESRAALGDLSGEEFMTLVQSRDVTARIAAAGREDAPLGVLVSFAQDRKTEVRVAVATNTIIGHSTAVQSVLADDRAVEVARALIRNSAVSRSIVDLLSKEGPRAARSEAAARLVEA